MYFFSLEYMELEIAICVSLNSHHGVLWAFDLGLNISGSHSQMEEKSKHYYRTITTNMHNTVIPRFWR